MKSTNQPPTELPAWKPRPPAAGLKRKIFAAHPASPEGRNLWNLLVPAVACMVLSLLVLNSNNYMSPGNMRNQLPANMLLSSLSYSADRSGTTQSAQNHVDSLTLEWTNRSVSPSSIGFTSSTN